MNDTSLPMMPWVPRDFIAATRAMRPAERGAYRELLDFQWELGVLPSDPERLARLIGYTAAEFEDVWPGIKDKFVVNGVGIYNKRLEEHRNRAIEQRDRKRRGAISTNAKRYGQRDAEHVAERDAERVVSASPPSPSPSPSPSPTEEKEKDSPLRARVASRHIDLVFEHWQRVHKHPEAKLNDKRRRLIAARLRDGYTLDQLRCCIDGYALSPFHRGENEQGTVYDSIDLMMRDAKQVEQGVTFHAKPPQPKPRTPQVTWTPPPDEEDASAR